MNILKYISKMYQTYNKASDMFDEPVLNFKFGLWKNDPMLPVWRNGPIINLFKRGSDYRGSEFFCSKGYSCYWPHSSQHIKRGKSPEGYDVYDLSTHKLPKGINTYKLVWRRDIRKKLKKYHLSWLRPTIELPRFFSFHIFNRDVMTKYKYDDIVYEFPPQFTIVLFGLSFSWWLTAPKSDDCFDDAYWETMINYINRDKDQTIVDIVEASGTYSTDDKNVKRICCRPEFLYDWTVFIKVKKRLQDKNPGIKYV